MHTPGPWWYCYDNDTGPDDDYYDDFYSIYGADDNRIGQADDSQYDACLIAAAPDLLDALADLLDGVESAIKSGDWNVDGACDPELFINRAKAAIAKATGETNDNT